MARAASFVKYELGETMAYIRIMVSYVGLDGDPVNPTDKVIYITDLQMFDKTTKEFVIDKGDYDLLNPEDHPANLISEFDMFIEMLEEEFKTYEFISELISKKDSKNFFN